MTPVREKGDHPPVPDHPLFARYYDRMTARAERGGLGEMRRELLSSAGGRVLELGAGTGHNLEHYTGAVTELVLAEPDPNMAKLLRERLERDGTAAGNPSVIEAPAEDLPFDDRSFDVVVATLVLCTVENPVRAVAETRRVLVEGGRFLYLEHVRAARPGLARWQDWLERPWGWVAGGCHPNRATDQLLAGAGFWIDSMEREALPKAPRLVRPLIRGVAIRPTGVGGS
ncbi:MAG TPA: class I SAM-dependent methyltransferase [Solirubrobacterales bacterium]